MSSFSMPSHCLVSWSELLSIPVEVFVLRQPAQTEEDSQTLQAWLQMPSAVPRWYLHTGNAKKSFSSSLPRPLEK